VKFNGNFKTDESLLKYLNDISRYSTLSREEEKQLAIKVKVGDKKAKERLINANLKFVVKIALNYQNRGLTLSELISDGNLGLIKAIEKFDPDKDIKLITYAIWWIRQRILFAIAEKSSLIRIPLGLNNRVKKLKNAKDKIFVEQGYAPDADQLSMETDISEQSINRIANTMFETLSLDEIDYNFGRCGNRPYSSHYENISIIDVFENSDSADPKTLVANEKIQETIQQSIKALDDREAYILKSYFGLEGFQEKNYSEIAKEIGISRERVRQIQKIALKKIFNQVYPVKVRSYEL